MQDNYKRSKNKSKKHAKEKDQKAKIRLESENFKSEQARCEFEQSTAKKVHNEKTVSPIIIEEIPMGSDSFVSFLQKDDKLVCEEMVSNFTFNGFVDQSLIQEEEETEALWEFMREQVKFEECYNHKKDYLNKQNYIQGHMVAILFDWLIEVTHSFHFKRETFYLGMNYVERFLMKQENLQISRFQLLGVTAIFIAHKCEEIYPKTLKDFHRLTQDQYTIQDIEEMEVCILKSLEFRMNPNTPIFWINYYTKLWDDYLIDKGINALFKERSNESYFRYRELIQFYDLCLIDYRYQQNEKLTALSLIYLVAAKSLQIFEDYSTMAISPSEINEFFNSENEYNYLFRGFISSGEFYLEFDIKIHFEDLNDAICDVLKYLVLRIDNSLPRVLINNQQFIDDIQYEELLSFQTYNRYTMQTIKEVSKYFQ